MLMEIDIRYPDFEEEYWNKKKIDEVRSTIAELIIKCAKLENENYEFRTENYCLKNKLNDLKIIHKDLEKACYKDADKRRELEKERDILKAENIRLKRRDFITENKNLRSKNNALEQKYWDAQRTIDKYAAENDELKKCKKDLTRWREMYYDLQKERDELENELLDAEDKLEENEREIESKKRYLEAYQRLYVDEVLKNRDLGKANDEFEQALAAIKKCNEDLDDDALDIYKETEDGEDNKP